MPTYYHVASETYTEGDDLYSYRELEAMGRSPKYKWDDKWGALEGYPDADVVCMFETLTEAEDFQSAHGGIILQIRLSEWVTRDGLRQSRKGYPCVARRIPATVGDKRIILVLNQDNKC